MQFNKQTLNKVIGTRGSSADVSIIHRHVVHLVKIKICRTSNFSCRTFRGKNPSSELSVAIFPFGATQYVT